MARVRRVRVEANGLPEARPGSVPAWCLVVPILAAMLLVLVASQRPDGRLHIWMLDVGQGDALLIRTPAGHTALVDGGPAATPLLNEAGERLPFWQRNIDLVVLTHPHEDHLMGLVELLDRYSVGQVVQTSFTSTIPVQGEWLTLLARKSIPVHLARRGETISFEGEPDLSLQVLSPATSQAVREEREGGVNNTSIVLRVSYGAHSALLEADAQAGAEADMLESEPDDLRADLLKVGHHGSSTSSTPRFLAAVHPAIALISVGAGNKFGHPVPSTLDALGKVGARVLRTDQNGTMEVIMDRERLWVRSER